jgi:hypothetical protein
MTAAAKVPDVVQKTYIHSTGMTGTPLRIVKYLFKVTKANDGDWIVTATYFQSGTPVLYNAVTIDSSSDGVQEGTVGLTYTNTGTKLTLSGGTTGTTYGEIWYEA